MNNPTEKMRDRDAFTEAMISRNIQPSVQGYEGWQSAHKCLMPLLVEARDALHRARCNLDEQNTAYQDCCDILAKLNAVIGKK